MVKCTPPMRPPENKTAAELSSGGRSIRVARSSALTGFEPALGLVDHVNAAFTAHDLTIAMPRFERAERVADLHGGLSSYLAPLSGAGFVLRPVTGTVFMVGATGIEPVTPTMST